VLGNDLSFSGEGGINIFVGHCRSRRSRRGETPWDCGVRMPFVGRIPLYATRRRMLIRDQCLASFLIFVFFRFFNAHLFLLIVSNTLLDLIIDAIA